MAVGAVLESRGAKIAKEDPRSFLAKEKIGRLDIAVNNAFGVKTRDQLSERIDLFLRGWEEEGRGRLEFVFIREIEGKFVRNGDAQRNKEATWDTPEEHPPKRLKGTIFARHEHHENFLLQCTNSRRLRLFFPILSILDDLDEEDVLVDSEGGTARNLYHLEVLPQLEFFDVQSPEPECSIDPILCSFLFGHGRNRNESLF